MNVAPNLNNDSSAQDTPEIRKYRKKFNSDILCAALWGKFEFTVYFIFLGLVALLFGKQYHVPNSIHGFFFVNT